MQVKVTTTKKPNLKSDIAVYNVVSRKLHVCGIYLNDTIFNNNLYFKLLSLGGFIHCYNLLKCDSAHSCFAYSIKHLLSQYVHWFNLIDKSFGIIEILYKM